MWKVIYADKAEKTRTKGKNEVYGLEINRPFYIVSRLPMKKVIQTNSSTLTIKDRPSSPRLTQQFFFDEVSKTIKSQQWKHISIYQNGASSVNM